jgi:outer membrane protein assembly factor BamB
MRVQFGRSPDFNSFTTSGPNASPKHAEWTFTAQNRVVTSPAVHDGVIYAGSDSGNVLALNATTGTQIWSVNTGSPVRSSPAVLADGSIIIGSYSGDVYHISASGKVLATAKTDYSVYAPVSVANGTAYVGSMDQHLYSIDIKSFAINWKFKGTSVMNSGAAVSQDGSRVYAMDYHGILYCIDAASGSQVWQAGTGSNGGGGSSPVLVSLRPRNRGFSDASKPSHRLLHGLPVSAA